MIVEKRWKLRNSNFSRTLIKQIKSRFDYSEPFVKILLQKQLDSPSKIDKFINCKLDHLHDPFLLPDVDKFIERIRRARKSNEKILVYGDYDVDGTVSATVLTRALKRIGIKNILTLAPHRQSGYGLNLNVVRGIKRLNYSLIITCDCGSADREAIEYAKSIGIDTIVTDHHQTIRHIHPYALINPQRKDSKYPFKELCGAGVVFKLIQALEKSGEKIDALRCLDYIAVATIADVAPLVDENRIITKFGLEMISNTKQIPLLTMMGACSLLGKKITSEMIGFMLGPRLNAPGRISSANITIKFLLENDPLKSKLLYNRLNSLNEKRKKVEQEIKESAIKQLEGKLNNKILVLSSKDWNKGVIGIVASVICQYYTRPTILIAIDKKGFGYGSVRNIEGFPLIETLHKCRDLLIRYGGHSMAAGLFLKEENIEAFSERLNNIADEILTDESLIPFETANLKLQEKEVSLDFIRELNLLEPFGSENETPMFVMEDVNVADYKERGKHLLLYISKEIKTFNAPGFWMQGYEVLMKDKEQKFDVLFELNENFYKNNCFVQLLIQDLKECKLLW
jgi:single-stranded-DNA-specific exonuclease